MLGKIEESLKIPISCVPFSKSDFSFFQIEASKQEDNFSDSKIYKIMQANFHVVAFQNSLSRVYKASMKIERILQMEGKIQMSRRQLRAVHIA